MTKKQSLENRTMSAFPLSIGTALAFETLFDGVREVYDPERPIPARVDVRKYQALWVNVATLFRNILGSVATADRALLLPGDIAPVVIEEMRYINDLFKDQTSSRVHVVFYAVHYKGMSIAHPHGKLREDTTPAQKEHADHLARIIKYLIKHRAELHDADIVMAEFDRVQRPAHPEKAIILTHCPYDLLASKHFTSLDLLESHTGTLKQKSAWYTKFNGGKDLVRIPFNACMLQVFGDSQTFHPQPIARRKQILDLSMRYKWNALTTKERLQMSFDNIPDHDFREQLKAMILE